MKHLLLIIILSISFNCFSQSVQTIEEKPINCCQHLDEEFGETWTILYWAKTKTDAIYMIDRYRFFDIANDYFESDGDYYIELIDPSDTLEYDSKYNFNLFNDYHKKT